MVYENCGGTLQIVTRLYINGGYQLNSPGVY